MPQAAKFSVSTLPVEAAAVRPFLRAFCVVRARYGWLRDGTGENRHCFSVIDAPIALTDTRRDLTADALSLSDDRIRLDADAFLSSVDAFLIKRGAISLTSGSRSAKVEGKTGVREPLPGKNNGVRVPLRLAGCGGIAPRPSLRPIATCKRSTAVRAVVKAL